MRCNRAHLNWESYDQNQRNHNQKKGEYHKKLPKTHCNNKQAVWSAENREWPSRGLVFVIIGWGSRTSFLNQPQWRNA